MLYYTFAIISQFHLVFTITFYCSSEGNPFWLSTSIKDMEKSRSCPLNTTNDSKWVIVSRFFFECGFKSNF